LAGVTTLGGCSEGVLDPKGRIASAERLPLINFDGHHARGRGWRRPGDFGFRQVVRAPNACASRIRRRSAVWSIPPMEGDDERA
jgi:hypothetical protein